MTRRVLIIEDDDTVRAAAAAAVEAGCACEAIVAARPRAGIHMAERQQPDLILLDTTLPELDTARVLVELHANPSTRDIPVILLCDGCPPPTDGGGGDRRVGADTAGVGGGVVGTIRKPVCAATAGEVLRLMGW